MPRRGSGGIASSPPRLWQAQGKGGGGTLFSQQEENIEAHGSMAVCRGLARKVVSSLLLCPLAGMRFMIG